MPAHPDPSLEYKENPTGRLAWKMPPRNAGTSLLDKEHDWVHMKLSVVGVETLNQKEPSNV